MKVAQLSVIVPIFQMSGKLEYLFCWLRESENFSSEIQVILVVDSADAATIEEVDKFCNNLSNFSGCVVKGDFNSPGKSRNAGIPYSTGLWVAFWDSDDLPNISNTLESLRIHASIDCDVIIGSYQVKDLLSDVVTTRTCFEPGTREFIFDIALQPGLWRFLFKHELAISERFPSSKMGEDQIYLTRIFAKVRNLSVSEKCFYIYHQNFPGQLTSNSSAKNELSKTISLMETAPYQREDLSLVRVFMLRKMLTTALRNGSWNSKLKSIRSFFQLDFKIRRNSPLNAGGLHFPWLRIAKELWKRHSN